MLALLSASGEAGEKSQNWVILECFHFLPPSPQSANVSMGGGGLRGELNCELVDFGDVRSSVLSQTKYMPRCVFSSYLKSFFSHHLPIAAGAHCPK